MRQREGKDHLGVARLRAARRVAARRAREGGFTLIELMVVIVMIAVLTMLAVPSMSAARDDRLAFDFARRFAGIIHHAKTRSAARGAAHLVTVDAGLGTQGAVYLFEALDGTAAPTGPNPVSGCKAASQWAFAATYSPGTVDALNKSAVVEGAFITGTAVGKISSTFAVDTVAQNALAMCVTPGGVVYVGAGSDKTSAINAMQIATAFTGLMEIDVQRHDGSGAAIGLKRRVLVPGDGAPRIKSE